MADYRHIGPALLMQERSRYYAKRARVWMDEGFHAMTVYYQRKAAEAHRDGYTSYLKFIEEYKEETNV